MATPRISTPAGELRPGDAVVVRPLEEIRATLDPSGALDGLPFMAEMERFAGRRLHVWKHADRVCVEGSATMHRLADTVMLEGLRCDGAAHGGCDRGCLYLWKTAWLARAGETPIAIREVPLPPAELPALAMAALGGVESEWRCQSTELQRAGTPLRWWDPAPYLRDVATGNLTPAQLGRAFATSAGGKLASIRRRARGAASPSRTPSASLGLRPGELVEVLPLAEIERTLDGERKNRGLEFAPGMELHCGHRYRVAKRVERIILETSGRMRTLRDTVVLEGVACDGVCARGCPRANLLYWREAWLRRVVERGEAMSVEAEARSIPVRPFVSVVMPCLNEERHIRAALRSILDGTWTPDAMEVLVVDGRSDDGTRAIVEEIARQDARVRLLDNPRRHTPAALNVGIADARGEVIVRTDAHTIYPRDYLAVLVRTLRETGADLVGCTAEVRPADDGLITRAIALAWDGFFATGRRRKVPRSGPAATVPYGCWPRAVFDRVGRFDERLLRNQDWEHARRIHHAGGKIHLTTDTRLVYYPRPTLRGLWRQAADTGTWNAFTERLYPYTFAWRHVLPGVFFVGAATAGGMVLLGVAGGQPLLAAAGASLLAPYAVANVAAALYAATRAREPWLAPLLSFIMASHHLAYGYGICRGWLLVASGAWRRRLGEAG